MENCNKVVVSLSGGLDSMCVALHYLARGYEVRGYAFDYGQKHNVELKKLRKNIKYMQSLGLKISLQVINLRDVFNESASALVGRGENGEIPHEDYRAENQKATVVENRNVIFSAIVFSKALAWANKTGENVVISQGVHSGDHCFTEDTKILTPFGYKTVKELRIGDTVYSMNTETGQIEEDTCLDVIAKGTNNEIYTISTTAGDIRLTAEHNVYVVNLGELTRSGFAKTIIKKKVKDLEEGDIMLTTAKLPELQDSKDSKIYIADVVSDFLKNMGYTSVIEDGNIIPVSTNGKRMTAYPVSMDAASLLNIMAWYITEGCTSRSKNPTSSKFLSSFCQSALQNLENCEIIHEDLNKLGIPISTTYKVLQNKIGDVVYQFNSVMSILMQTCGNKSADKRIPNWIMEFLMKNPSFINGFVCTMANGDGHYDPISGLYSYTSKSPVLIEQLSFLIKLAGFYVKINHRGEMTVIYFGNKTRKQGLTRYNDGAMARVMKITINNSIVENVYDISVKNNHNFFAGEYGNVLISNSIYPDCRPESVNMAKELYKISNWGTEKVDFEAPFVNETKGEALRDGMGAMKALGLTKTQMHRILRNTHSCYDPDEKGKACGLCGTCRERLEAFACAGFMDPAKYSNPKAAKELYNKCVSEIKANTGGPSNN